MQPRLASFIVFFTIALLLVSAMHYYVWYRLARSTALPHGWQRTAAVAIGLAALATPAGLFLARRLDRATGRWIADVTFSWVGLLFVLLTLLWVTEPVRAIVLGGARLLGRPLAPEQRILLGRALAGLVAVVGVGAAVWGRLVVAGQVPAVNVRVELARLPASASGFRIVQLTDLHVGDSIDRAWLARVVEQTNALEPDLIAITGDLVDGSVAALGSETEPLGSLRAKHGVFFVTGNHEYYSGADEWIAEVRRLGIRVLRNERVSIDLPGGDGFDLAGVDDWTAFGAGHGPDLAKAVASRDPSRELVLLAHEPREADRAQAAGVGLMLSGHTHGGQIVPWNFAVRLQQPYVAGLVKQGELQIYVSRGAGYWGPPMRIGAPPEISVIELRARAGAAER